MGTSRGHPEQHSYMHNGSWIGYTGDLLHIPEKKITLVWLRNQEGDPKHNCEFMAGVLKLLKQK